MNEGWPGVSEPLPNARLRVLSLGAGVQSSTLALMAARGEIGPMPDCAIFADTGWERRKTYEWLAWLGERLPFPIYKVTNGDLRADVLQPPRGGSSRIPAFVWPPGEERAAPTVRACTRDYKVNPIEKHVRKLLDLTGRRAPKTPIVEQWIGMSTDEMQRLKDSRTMWIKHRWPLIELRMDRRACLRWLEERQYPKPIKSACIGCPHRDNAAWREIRSDPDEWADAVALDAALRDPAVPRTRTVAPLFLHRSCVPLAEAPIDEPDTGQLDMFADECEGMCGV